MTATLDPAPLVAAIDHAARTVGWERRADGQTHRVGPGRWAERHGICSTRQYRRWTSGQQVTIRTADRTAIALGWHPCELWGADWCATDDKDQAA